MAAPLLFFLFSAVIGVIIYFLFSKKNKKDTPPLPPLMGGNMFSNVEKMTAVTGMSPLDYPHSLSEQCKEGNGKTPYGAVYRLSMPMLPHYIVSTDYHLNRLVTEGDSSSGLPEAEKTTIARGFDLIDTPSILSQPTSSQERYQTRKHIAVSFSLKNLKYTQTIIFKALDVFRTILERHEKTSVPINFGDLMLRLSFDIVTESSFNTNFQTQLNQHSDLPNPGNEYLQNNEIFLKECARKLLNPFRKYMFWSPELRKAEECRQKILNFSQLLMKSYQPPPEGVDSDFSIMGRLMSCHYPNEITRAQDILIFLGGGHETSSHSLTYLILALSTHPEVLSKLQMELDTAIPSGARGDAELFPSASTLLSLPYLGMCIKESMRMWSVVGIGPKRIVPQDIIYQGMCLPKGSIIHTAFHSMWRQSWIDRPNDFIPERWEDSNPQISQLKEAFMPFNVGTRQCIGQNLARMEMAMVAAYLIRFFEFQLISKPETHVFLTVKAVNVIFNVKSRF